MPPRIRTTMTLDGEKEYKGRALGDQQRAEGLKL